MSGEKEDYRYRVDWHIFLEYGLLAKDTAARPYGRGFGSTETRIEQDALYAPHRMGLPTDKQLLLARMDIINLIEKALEKAKKANRALYKRERQLPLLLLSMFSCLIFRGKG